MCPHGSTAETARCACAASEFENSAMNPSLALHKQLAVPRLGSLSRGTSGAVRDLLGSPTRLPRVVGMELQTCKEELDMSCATSALHGSVYVCGGGVRVGPGTSWTDTWDASGVLLCAKESG